MNNQAKTPTDTLLKLSKMEELDSCQKQFNCFLMGETSLLIQCAELLLKRDHQILGIVSPDRAIGQWANKNGIPYIDPQDDWTAFFSQFSFDYLFSIVNSVRLPPEILALPRKLAINYHDSPLPKYAGINATSWALMNREKSYAVTWHVMSDRFDEGDILKQFSVEIAESDTAFTLNAKCYEAAIYSFSELINELSEETVKIRKQNLEERTYFSPSKTPMAGFIFSWNRCALDINAFVRALDFGSYRNPLGTPKFAIESDFIIVSKFEVLDSPSEFSPGTVTAIEPGFIKISTASYDIALHQVLNVEGQNLSISELVAQFGLYEGYQFKDIATELAKDIETFDSEIRKHELFWVNRLTTLQPINVPYAKSTTSQLKAKCYVDVNVPLSPNVITFLEESHPEWNRGNFVLAVIVAYLARLGGVGCFDIGFRTINLPRQLNGIENFWASYIPYRIDINLDQNFQAVFAAVQEQVELTKRRQTYPRDIAVRYPELKKALSGSSQQLFPVVVEQVKNLAEREKQPSKALRLVVPEDGKECCWSYDPEIFDESSIDRMLRQFETFVESLITNLDAIAGNIQQSISDLPLLTEKECHQLLVEWNNTWAEYPQDKCIHELFEAQVERSPDAVAVVFEGKQLTYRELNARANQLAHYLRSLGVGPEVLVGICVERSLEMIIGLLGILKAGGAYVPLDPNYPSERLAFMLEDSSVPVLLSQEKLVEKFPQHSACVVCLDSDWEKIAVDSKENPSIPVKPKNLAYVIYTSGSTGKPKGVLIQHESLVNYTTAASAEYEIDQCDRILQFSSISFDVSAEEIYTSLTSGATLILRTDSMLDSVEGFLQKCKNWEITVMALPTAYWYELTAFLSQKTVVLPPSLRLIIIGGEKALPERLKTWLQCVEQQVRLVNNYGPTEATVGATIYDLSVADTTLKELPIGRPLGNVQTYILDGNRQPVPIGVPGELHIGGAGLARGYLNRPDLTDQRFIPNPFSNEPGERLYKTGDLARYLPDGNIEFIGRIDNQVKIRGFRIELGEIETAISQHPLVKEAVVIATENNTDNKQIVAYIALPTEVTPHISDLRHFLKQKLPDYMIPAAFVMLDNLPLTPTGKVDRRALPSPELRPDLELTFISPRTPIEEILASIWACVLGIEQVGVHDNFFELGGHSLLATQVISRVHDTMSVELPLRSLFEAPTIAEFASRVEIALKNGKSVEALPLLPIPRSESIPLSFAQTRLWFLDRLQPDSAFYNIPLALRLFGQLNIAALQSSINEIIRRHEALRTNFAIVGYQPVQVIASTLSFQLPVVNLLHLCESQREIEAKRLATVEVNRPFNLEQEPLLRGMVLQLGETEYVLLLTMHHIISDGWSLGVFIRELTELYQAFCTGKPPVLPELPVQYADFALWQRQWLTGEILETQLDYWKEQLKNAPNLLELPTDRPRPAVQTFGGGYYHAVLPQELSAELTTLSKRAGVTMFMTLLAAFQTLLYRYSGQDDIVVGTPVAGRNRQEIERLIGFFVNTLVLRTDLSDNPTFEQLLNRVREVALQAYANQDLPFEQLVEALQPTRDLSYTPLFQVMFALDNALVPFVELPDLTASSYSLEIGTAKFDLTLSMENTVDGLVGVWEYNADLFDEVTIARIAGHFQTLLEAIAVNPIQPISELPLLIQRERYQLLIEWNNTTIDYPQDKCIHQLFEEQVALTPDAVALVFKGEQLTYGELNRRANKLAHYLQSLGVGPEVLVGICVERSFDMIVGLLGILKAGGAYVPIDPAYPTDRIAYMLDDSRLPVLLTQKQLAASLPEHQARVVCLDSDWQEISTVSGLPPITDLTPENLAYVIYTSGSTGKPKGVKVAHRGLCNLVHTQIKLFDVQPDSRVLQFASISFDASIWEIIMALCTGGHLYLGTQEELQPGPALLQLLQEQKITHANLVPSVLAALPDDELPALQNIVVGGEECPPFLVERWAKGRRFFNLYGPTESTVCATISQCFKGTGLPSIGRPLANTQIYILDRHKQPVPIGVSGELNIAGVGLAKGYLNRPELTQEKFIPNPFSNEPGSRLYKTGDLARYLPDGNIEFLGRIDNQVKIRGFRIELGEIEAVLAKHPNVRSVTVIDREDAPGNKRLVAYLVSNLIPERVPYHSECQLELDGNAITIHTQDISTGGVGLVGVPAIERGKSVRVHMQLPGESEPHWLSGTVVWSRPPQAGIRFHLTPSEQAQIEQSVDYQLDTQDLWKTLQRTVTRNLRHYLKQKLPDYMIPSAFVLMKALPLTPNGKIDRRALPAPDNFHNEQEDKFVGPGTPTEAKMAAIWAEVLGLKRVGINDNFFELGGHSLLAAQIISRMGQAFAIELPLRLLFEAPTIASLGKMIEPRLHLASQEQSEDSAVSESLPALTPVPRETHIPLSKAQEYIWYVQQLNPHRCGCNSGVALRFSLKLSSEALEKSINEIIHRHEIMRTTFPIFKGQPVQAIAPELTLPLKIVDLQNIPLAKRETEAIHFSQREMNYHFDLANGPLIKTTLVRLSSEEHWLLMPMHHIITDGWSVGLFVEELETLYTAFSKGLPSPLPEMPLQYADFTLWQRQRFNEEALARQVNYWLQKLAAPLQTQEYLPDREPKPNSNSGRASFYSLVLRENIIASLKDLSRSHSVTISTIIIAALKLLLFKWSGQSEIMIVATIGNRSTPEIEKMLGCFINDVILRSQLDDEQTGVALLEQVKQTLNEAIANKEIPLQQVIEAVKSQRKLALSASVTIVPPVESPDGRFVSEIALGSDKDQLWDEEIPLELYISSSSEKSKSMEIYVLYSTDLFGSETIERMFNCYQKVLQKLAESPQMKIAEFDGFQEKNREAAQ